MLDKNKILTVIIPTYNGNNVLQQCIQSLFKQTFSLFYITIVDNGSTDGTIENVKLNYKNINLIEYKYNTGFSKAINAGIKDSKTPFIMLLNNDTIASPNFIRKSLDGIINTPSNIGAVNPLMLFMDKEKIDNIGICINKYWKVGPIGMNKEKAYFNNKTKEIFGVNAGGSIYKKVFFEDVGLFDEDFFAYYEDVDLSIRGKLKGWKYYHNPNAIVFHHHSYTGNRINNYKNLLLRRNYIYYLFKNASMHTFLYNMMIKMVLKDIGNIAHFLKSKKGRTELFRNVYGYYYFVINIKKMYKKRASILKTKKCEINNWYNIPFKTLT